MYKKLLIFFVVLFSMVSSGCLNDSDDIKISKSYTVSTQEKTLLRNYILETREVMRPYRNKMEEQSKMADYILNSNNLSASEINNRMTSLCKEEVKNLDEMHSALKRVKIPSDCPTAERLALLREKMYDKQRKVMGEVSKGNIISTFIESAKIALFNREKELDVIQEEIDNIFSLAEINPE